jgi:hypothetical protein
LHPCTLKFYIDHGSNISREKDIPAEDVDLLASDKVEKLGAGHGGNGPMMGLVGALVFGMYIL